MCEKSLECFDPHRCFWVILQTSVVMLSTTQLLWSWHLL